MLQLKKSNVFYQKIAIDLSLGLNKGRPSNRRSLVNPQKRTYTTSKHEISQLFPIFVGHFWAPDPDPVFESGLYWIIFEGDTLQRRDDVGEKELN